MEQLLAILNSIRPDLDFAAEKALVTDGILDSFDIISIVNDVNEAFFVDIDAEDLVPENFDSAEAIMSLIDEHQNM